MQHLIAAWRHHSAVHRISPPCSCRLLLLQLPLLALCIAWRDQKLQGSIDSQLAIYEGKPDKAEGSMILHCLLAYDVVIAKDERVAAGNALMPDTSQCFKCRDNLSILVEQSKTNFDMHWDHDHCALLCQAEFSCTFEESWP